MTPFNSGGTPGSISAKSAPRVVVLGAGFGGLAAIRVLRRKPAQVTWVDRRNHHLFQPLLYQVATAALSPADVATPVREIVRGSTNVDVRLETTTAIDRIKQTVTTLSGGTLPYDFLVIATGAETSYFGHDAWADRADGLKDLDEAITIRRKILLALERAEIAASDEERRRLLAFILIGAGPTGIELAGAIADLAKHMLARDFHKVRPELISVVLLEAKDQVLPGFPSDLAAFAHRKLSDMGVEVRTGTMVEEIDDDGVVAAGNRVAASLCIWTAGVKATPVARWLGVDADKGGRVRVGADLALPDDPRVFVIGDAALATGEDGAPLPGLAAVAKQQGTFVGRRIVDLIKGRPARDSFHYRDWGTLATMGRASAVADFGSWKFRGFGAWVVWAIVHIWYLIDFRNRMRVLINWTWQYLAYAPGSRLITGDRQRNETTTRSSPALKRVR
jgi:NADH dehydrogenase, FAD-containing subunit